MPVVAGRDRDPPIRPHVNAIGIEEARALHKAKFADRKVDAQAIRQALMYLGVCPPDGRSLAATFGMCRIAPPDRAA